MPEYGVRINMNIIRLVRKFLDSDAAGGILLLTATTIALLMENSVLSSFYHYVREVPVILRFDQVVLDYPLHHWVTEGLMVIFFIAVGLEIKREFLAGQLANLNYVLLPAIAATCGIIVPGIVFLFFNYGSDALAGWAIPTATDIAFAVGVIALFGNRLPSSVRIFILTLAVLDDIGAIIIIGLFYSSDINLLMVFYTSLCLAVLILLNILEVRFLVPYMLVGALAWFFMLGTGVHPTLTGILIAMCVPLNIRPGDRLPHAFGMNLGQARLGYVSPAIRLEHALNKSVNFAILPLFAFVNSGVDIGSILADKLLFSPISAGTFIGLFIGKPLGVVIGVFIWQLAVRERLPAGLSYLEFLGMGLICGMGYTMSILINTIAFEGNTSYINQALLGILSGSFMAAIVGSLIFVFSIRRHAQNVQTT